MNNAEKARSARHSLRLLAGELGVSLRDISEADQEIVAIRFVLDGRPTTEVLQAIVDDVRREALDGTSPLPAAEREGVTGAPTTPPPSPKRGYRFNATEADNRARQKLASVHRIEDARSGLTIRPRRPQILPVGKPHPACLAAARERLWVSVCIRCAWLLDDNEEFEAWLDRDDA